MMMKIKTGTRLMMKLFVLETWKAVDVDPTIIKKIVPGPKMVPTINMHCRSPNTSTKTNCQSSTS